MTDTDLHTISRSITNIPNTTNKSDKPTFVDFSKACLPVQTLSRKPKPWHVVKKRGIVPDGLVLLHVYLPLCTVYRLPSAIYHLLSIKQDTKESKVIAPKMCVNISG